MNPAYFFLLLIGFTALTIKSEDTNASGEITNKTAAPEETDANSSENDKNKIEEFFYKPNPDAEEARKRRHEKTKKDLNDMMLGKTRSIVGCFLLIDNIMTMRNKDDINSILERTALNKTQVYQRIKIDLIRECEDKVNDDNLATLLLRSSDKYPDWNYLDKFAKYNHSRYLNDKIISLEFTSEELVSVKHYAELVREQKINTGEIETPLPKEHIDINVFDTKEYNNYHKIFSLVFIMIMACLVVYAVLKVDFSGKGSLRSAKEKKKLKKK